MFKQAITVDIPDDNEDDSKTLDIPPQYTGNK